MRFARTLLLLACAALLQACATYYYSSPPGGQRTVNAEDEYYYGSGVGYATIDYSAVPYYPWWSMDYYYLGPHYYSPWYAGYASGWYSSLGYAFVYPPFYRPYGFAGSVFYPFAGPWYDPWYASWYGPRYGPWYGSVGVSFAWYDTYWRNQYDDHVRDHYPVRARDDYGNSRVGYRDFRRDLYPDPRDRAPAASRYSRSIDPAATSRDVYAAPSSRSADSGMVVRSRRERKIEESHIGPAPIRSPSVSSSPGPSVSVVPSNPAPSRTVVIPDSRSVTTMPRPVRQAPPPQARPSQPSQPVTSPPRVIRQSPPPQAKPIRRSAPIRSAPSAPPSSAGPSDSGGPAYSDSPSRRRN